MRRSLLIVLMFLAALGLGYSDTIAQDRATLNMLSNVPAGAGVDVPDDVELVGNLLIEYSTDASNWYPVTGATVNVEDLGLVAGSVYLQASYYGNEPTDYNCTVTFSTGGWNRSGRSVMARTLSQLSNEDSDLPISFSHLNVSFNESGTSRTLADSGNDSYPVVIVNEAGGEGNSFDLYVPVQSPINGRLVATIQADWETAELASGVYEADVMVTVSSS